MGRKKVTREASQAGQTAALQQIVEKMLLTLSGPEGSLTKTVQGVVLSALEPVLQQLGNRSKQSTHGHAARASEDAIQKGIEYEMHVVELLQSWGRHSGARVEHVGADNRPGDIVVEFPSHRPDEDGLRVVVEVRNRQNPEGRKAVSALLEQAAAVRTASAAIYLSRTSEGLGSELRDWSEGECRAGPFVICTHEHLITALRYLHTKKSLVMLRRNSLEIDQQSIRGQIGRIRTTLEAVRKISRLGNEIRSATWEMDDETDRLRQEIRDALRLIEDALRDQNAIRSAGPG